jgi:hypothetical protein
MIGFLICSQNLYELLTASPAGVGVLEYYTINNELDKRTRAKMLELIVKVSGVKLNTKSLQLIDHFSTGVLPKFCENGPRKIP